MRTLVSVLGLIIRGTIAGALCEIAGALGALVAVQRELVARTPYPDPRPDWQKNPTDRATFLAALARLDPVQRAAYEAQQVAAERQARAKKQATPPAQPLPVGGQSLDTAASA